MKQFTVTTDAIGGRFGKTFKRGDVVHENQFQPGIAMQLAHRGFLLESSGAPIPNAPQPVSLFEPDPDMDNRAGLKIFQIYYKDEQLPELDYTPYRNARCNYYFEHQVMVDLINQGAHLESYYFGVLSHKFREKISFTKHSGISNIANKSVQEFTPELFERELFRGHPDAMSVQRHIPHDPISFGDRFHPGLSALFQRVLNEIGYNWSPTPLANVFYCNYFVARSDVYEDYVKTMLEPAMEVMDRMPELLKNSGYPKPLPDNLRDAWGIDYYPYHTFICERMFSYYAHLKNLKCLHY